MANRLIALGVRKAIPSILKEKEEVLWSMAAKAK